eukprot:scaffold16625_cov118-Cylindrotheca_fusiformis.AAC.4
MSWARWRDSSFNVHFGAQLAPFSSLEPTRRSSTMAKKSQSPRHKPVVKLTEELKTSEKVEFMPTFLLGAAFAVLLVAVPFFSGILWMCKDVPVSPVLPCPQIVSKKESKKRGILGFLKQKQSTPNEVELELKVPDPKDSVCRLVWGFFSGGNQDAGPPMTCIPDEKESTPRRPSPELVEKYKSAYTPEKFEVSSAHSQLIVTLGERTRSFVPDWDERSDKVMWGGTGWPWRAPKRQPNSDATDLEKLDGGSLYFSYLRIMQWPQSLFSHFPFKLCSKGCNSEVAVAHTLEFREKYQPWMFSPTVKKENEKGFVFFHGFSESMKEGENGSHGIVWIRPGLRTKIDDVAQTRAYVNSLERAVAESLIRSNGRVGKFNVVMDGSGFSMGLTPSIHQVKVFVTMLQDHFPDKLGMILIANLGRVGDIVVRMFLPLISEEVRNKIIVLPKEPGERQRILNAVVGYENSPTWLGGVDTYQFNSDDYYSDAQFLFSDEEAKAYIETMPYHA